MFMPRSVAERMASVHPKMLAVSDERLQSRSETHPKRLGEQEWRERIGRTIDRALRLAEVTKQEMSHAMGYGNDQSSISKWITGKERPQFDKLFGADGDIGDRFYVAWVIACAEKHPSLDVTTEIRAKRTA